MERLSLAPFVEVRACLIDENSTHISSKSDRSVVDILKAADSRAQTNTLPTGLNDLATQKDGELNIIRSFLAPPGFLGTILHHQELLWRQQRRIA